MTKDYRRAALRGELLLVTPQGMQMLQDKISSLLALDAKLLEQKNRAVENYPDLRENSSYDEINSKLEYQLPTELAGWKDKQASALVHEEEAKTDEVVLGCVVDLEVGGHPSRYLFAGPIEAALGGQNEPTPVSYMSPLGRAIWGRRKGDIVAFEAPGGNRKVEILSVQRIDTPAANN